MEDHHRRSEDTKSRRTLTIECLGPAEARDVRIKVDGERPGHWGTIRGRTGNEALMRKGEHLRFPFVMMDGMRSISTVSIAWESLDGRQQYVEVSPRYVDTR